MGANARDLEVAAIGQILTFYNNLEVGLLNCVKMGIDDFDLTFKTMFRARNSTDRIKHAKDLGLKAYESFGLKEEFLTAIQAIKYALKIRNQYAHWTWWDDLSGQLAIANLEDLAKTQDRVTGLDMLAISHVDMPLLNAQQEFFIYVDKWISWVNYEGRFVRKLLNKRHCPKPIPVTEPALRYDPEDQDKV